MVRSATLTRLAASAVDKSLGMLGIIGGLVILSMVNKKLVYSDFHETMNAEQTANGLG